RAAAARAVADRSTPTRSVDADQEETARRRSGGTALRSPAPDPLSRRWDLGVLRLLGEGAARWRSFAGRTCCSAKVSVVSTRFTMFRITVDGDARAWADAHWDTYA